jgi:hypothetical protein
MTPILEANKKKSLFAKYFGKTKGFFKGARIARIGLNGNKRRMFSKLNVVSKQYLGIGGMKLLRSLIKWVPKYMMYAKTMRAAVLLRCIRGMHLMKKAARDVVVKSHYAAVSVRLSSKRMTTAVKSIILLNRMEEMNNSSSSSTTMKMAAAAAKKKKSFKLPAGLGMDRISEGGSGGATVVVEEGSDCDSGGGGERE